MDQAIHLDHQEISLNDQPIPNHQTDIFFYEPIDVDQREHRGSFLCLIETQNNSEKPIDLKKLTQELYKTLLDEYYTDKVGSPLEALELATQAAQKRNHLLAENLVETKIGTLAIWGNVLVYYNPHNTLMGIRRHQEFFELDPTGCGNEELKNKDLIIVASAAFTDFSLTPRLREDSNLTNEEFKTRLSERSDIIEPTQPLRAHLIYFTMTEVPAEEEIIEIHCPNPNDEKPQRSYLETIKRLTRALRDKLPHLNLILLKNSEPRIYLKNNVANSRYGKLLLVLLVLVLLVASILGTNYISRHREQARKITEALNQTRQQIEKARELSSLSPAESAKLLGQAKISLGLVKGVRDEDNREFEALSQQFAEIERAILRATSVEPTPSQLDDPIKQRIVSISPTGVSDFSGQTLLTRDSNWNDPIQADSYFGNLYLLDSVANRIWKYVQLGNNYAPAQNYLKEEANLQNALDITVDGSIYILFQDRVEKFTVGKKQDFKLKGVFLTFSENSRITTGPDASSVFISIPQGVLVFNKDGEYQKLLSSPILNTIEDLVCTDDGNLLFVKKNNEWFKINLGPK